MTTPDETDPLQPSPTRVRASLADYNLTHGMPALVSTTGEHGTGLQPSRLLGWDGGRSVILELPAELESAKAGDGLRIHLDFGFQLARMKVRAIGVLTGDAPVLVAAWPDEVELTYLRRALRFTVDFECALFRLGDESRTAFAGRMTDISTGGCRVHSDGAFAVGEKVLIDLTLPGGARVRRLLSVVRNLRVQGSGFAYGIEFDEAMYITLTRVTNYVQSLIGNPEAPWVSRS
jgi:hypothetical protein